MQSKTCSEWGRRHLKSITFAITWFVVITHSYVAQADTPQDWVKRCAPDSSAHGEAVTVLHELNGRVRRPMGGEDLEGWRAAFTSLMNEPCFELALASERRHPRFESMDGARIWWTDGGHDWLVSFLEQPLPQRSLTKTPTARTIVILPPTERTYLSSDSAPEHPLSSLYCPTGDRECGGEVDAWRRQADVDLRGRHAIQRGDTELKDEDWSTRNVLEACAHMATRSSRDVRYRHWLSCVLDAYPSHPAVPIGRFKAPDQGTLLLFEYGHTGRGCLRASSYDLATGTAFMKSDCSEDAYPMPNRSTAPPMSVQDGLRMGETSKSTIRRALWMLISSDHMEARIHTRAVHVPLPADIEMTWRRTAEFPSSESLGFGLGGGGMSHYRVLHWAWIRENQIIYQGRIKLNGYSPVATMYALELLAVAEGGYRASCPTMGPPKDLTHFKNLGIGRSQLERFEGWTRMWRQHPSCLPMGPRP